MIRRIDSFLNSTTLYRVVLYELLFLLAAALVLGALHALPFSPSFLLYSAVVLFVACWTTNTLFAYFFDAPSNPESTYITALILVLIITPPQSFGDMHFLTIALWGSAWAMASKYIFALGHKHLFNPAAFGVALSALVLNQGASWWVGTIWMLPFVAVGGFLIARKTRRLDMVIAFGSTLVLTILALGGDGSLHVVQQALLYAPAVFFGTVLLIEPLTAPADRHWRILFAVLVAFLFAPEVHFGRLFFSPELALLAGNLFAYVVSPKEKLLLTLKKRVAIAADAYEFTFSSNRRLNFKPGQYLEWTLAHPRADTRGIRRYFTIASSPGEKDVRIAVRFNTPTSSFKKALLSMPPGNSIIASQRAGDFVLPRNTKQKLVFIAGGIGITPFHSMIQSLIDRKERRDIVLVYLNRSLEHTAYAEFLDVAGREIGVRVLPLFTGAPPQAAPGEFSSIFDRALLEEEIPDYHNRLFYLSGPNALVDSFSGVLRELGVPSRTIKKDFFPGFA